MKKIISLVLAAFMAVSVFAVSVVPAMAAKGNVNSPTATTAAPKAPVLEVNGSTNKTDISYSPDKNDDSVITFTYNGDGILYGWEDNLEDLGLVEGVDYTATFNADKSYTIHFLSNEALEAWNNGEVSVNALVKGLDDGTSTTGNESNKSPNTGLASSAVATTVALAGAGLAVLSASKKKDAE